MAHPILGSPGSELCDASLSRVGAVQCCRTMLALALILSVCVCHLPGCSNLHQSQSSPVTGNEEPARGIAGEKFDIVKKWGINTYKAMELKSREVMLELYKTIGYSTARVLCAVLEST
eukprot:g42652.t1